MALLIRNQPQKSMCYNYESFVKTAPKKRNPQLSVVIFKVEFKMVTWKGRQSSNEVWVLKQI